MEASLGRTTAITSTPHDDHRSLYGLSQNITWSPSHPQICSHITLPHSGDCFGPCKKDFGQYACQGGASR
eukprot:10088825-Prorocentrum_lima.AAC.1